jgi:hypothetical protein
MVCQAAGGPPHCIPKTLALCMRRWYHRQSYAEGCHVRWLHTHGCDDTWISDSCVMVPGMAAAAGCAAASTPLPLHAWRRSSRSPASHILQGASPHLKRRTTAGTYGHPMLTKVPLQAQLRVECTCCCRAAADAMPRNPCQIWLETALAVVAVPACSHAAPPDLQHFGTVRGALTYPALKAACCCDTTAQQDVYRLLSGRRWRRQLLLALQ